MKKVIGLLLALFIISGLQFAFVSARSFRFELFGDLVTFLSILFGFYITSFAIFASSKYVSSLYQVVSKSNPSISLLHSLVGNYKAGITISLLSLIYLIAVEFLLKPDVNGLVPLGNKILLPFIAMVAINFWYCFKMLCDLANVVIQEGKNSEVRHS